MIEIFINNKKYTFENNLTILQACEQANIEIPRFCYHDKLSVAGNCRMCLVEIEKAPKPIASCAMPISNNMRVYTDTPLVKKAREAVLEFLLINHPLDCPICDQGGECDLQDITLNFGSDRTRFFEYKRGVEDKECGPIIKTIMTRCIHCTRCVRFMAEIAGVESLGTICRGENTEIGTYVDKFIKSELSGNLVDLCPVGALTSKPYAFSARTWELKKFESIDFTDSLCSNIVVYTRNNMPNKFYKFKNSFENKDEIMRILPKLNDDINENWISDKTRYSFDGYNYQRLKKINIFNKNINKYVKYNWIQFLVQIYKKFNFIQNKNIKKNILGNIGSISNIESLFFFNKFLKTLGSSDIQINNKLSNFNIDAPCFYQFNSTLKAVEKSDLILLIGCNPRYEASMLNLKIRKQFTRFNIPIGLIGNPVDLTYPVEHLGSSTKTLIELSEGKNKFCQKIRKSTNPLIIVGSEFLSRKDHKALLNLLGFLGKKTFINLKNYNGLNFVHSNLSQINACELGIQPGPRSFLHLLNNKLSNKKSIDFSFFMNLDKLDNNLNFKESEKFLLNTHRVEGLFDNLIPINGHFERNSLLFNTEGRLQKAYKTTSSYKYGRNSEDFLKTIIKLNEGNIDSFTNSNLIKNIPFIKNQNKIREKFHFNFLDLLYNKNNKNKIYLSNFKPIINNFYMNNIIEHNSKVMAECSIFLNNKTNFIKNLN